MTRILKTHKELIDVSENFECFFYRSALQSTGHFSQLSWGYAGNSVFLLSKVSKFADM